MKNPSLRKQLLFTIVVLMLFVSSAIVWVSIQAGTDAVNNLTQRVMLNMIERIGNDNEHQLNEAMRALESIAPFPGDKYPDRLNKKNSVLSETLEQRLWLASQQYAKTTGSLYFAWADGSFIGIHSTENNKVHLFLRSTDNGLRKDYLIQNPGDRSQLIGERYYDARSRAWYLNAVDHEKPVWSEVYNNFSNSEPTITLAKAVYQPGHRLLGVAAIDITLQKLSDYLRTIHVSDHSVAYIVDSNGFMIASSSSKRPYDLISNQPKIKLAENMEDPLIRQSYSSVIKDQIITSGMNIAATRTFTLNSEQIDVAYASLGNQSGLNWISVIAVPRSDFMGGINHSVIQSILIVVVFIILALIAGLMVIEHMLKDIRQLTQAALKVGNGEPLPRLHIHRKDEIGNLVKTFIDMENKLRFDRLTQVNNRDFLIAQIESLQQHATLHPDEKVNFTLLFLDLDKFKTINDGYGHAAGDQLLIIIASRLKAAVRETDTVARFGGDEFVVLLNGTSETLDIENTINKIHELVEQPIALSDHLVSIQVSIGWSVFPTEAMTYSRLIDIADARMFSGKKNPDNPHLKLVP